MNKFFLATVTAATLFLGACSGFNLASFTNKVQVDQTKIEAAIDASCTAANAAAAIAAPFASVPQVAGVLTFVSAGCGTSEAVAALVTKAVNDPGTIAWTQKLVSDVQTAVAQAQGVKL